MTSHTAHGVISSFHLKIKLDIGSSKKSIIKLTVFKKFQAV